MKAIGRLRNLLFNIFNQYDPTSNEFYFKEKYYDKSVSEKKEKIVIYMRDGKSFHGGLTDSIRGVLTVFEISKQKKIPFYINWHFPFRLEEFLIPNEYDWTIPEKKIMYNKNSHPIFSFTISNRKLKSLYDKFFLKYHIITSKKQLHIYSNQDYYKTKHKENYNKLFKPSLILEEELTKHKQILGDKYYSYSFRFRNLLNDFKDLDSRPLSEEEQKKLIDKNLSKLKALLKDLPSDYKALVASDSKVFLNRVKEIDERIYIVEGDIKHMDEKQESDELSKSIWLKTFVDQYLIMGAKKIFLLITDDMYNSGFPDFAASIAGKSCNRIYF